MCGIALILGPQPDRETFRQMITSLAPRGEVEEVLLTDRLLAGTQRLRSDSDTEVVLEAVLEWGAAAVRRLFLHKIRNLCRTELQRLDRASMGHGTELRVPFLDLALVELAMRLPREFKQRHGQDKWILRHAFADFVPDYIRQRPKDMMSYSTGLHERARLFKPLFPRLHRSFGYDLLEPVRRDFDTVLERCGHDLDRAIADAAARQDYRLTERARDLAGAARWNAVLALRRPAKDS